MHKSEENLVGRKCHEPKAERAIILGDWERRQKMKPESCLVQAVKGLNWQAKESGFMSRKFLAIISHIVFVPRFLSSFFETPITYALYFSCNFKSLMFFVSVLYTSPL